jgi:restriction system protein
MGMSGEQDMPDTTSHPTAIPDDGPRRRSGVGRTPVVLISAFIVAMLAGQIAAHAVSRYWPLWLLTGLAIIGGTVLRRAAAAGRVEAAGERDRLEAIAEAQRHRDLAALDRMTGPAFEKHVANLCRRDGLEIVRDGGGAGDLGADVIARAPDGRLIVIQCKRYKAEAPVSGPEMQRFLGTVRTVHNADVPVFVTTARRFTRQARQLAVSHNVILMDRNRLALWNSGSNLVPFLSMPPIGEGIRGIRGI